LYSDLNIYLLDSACAEIPDLYMILKYKHDRLSEDIIEKLQHLFYSNILRLKILLFLTWDIEKVGEVKEREALVVNNIGDYIGMKYVNNTEHLLNNKNLKLNIESKLLDSIFNNANLS
jgi:hypothetical protein